MLTALARGELREAWTWSDETPGDSKKAESETKKGDGATETQDSHDGNDAKHESRQAFESPASTTAVSPSLAGESRTLTARKGS